MTRLVVGFFLLGVLCSVQARKCDPNEGTDPLPCDPSVCLLPDCACETTEPDIPLADRPQVSILIRVRKRIETSIKIYFIMLTII